MSLAGETQKHAGSSIKLPRLPFILSICLLAVVLRLAFCATLDFKVIQFGDAYFYLSGASNILKFVADNWHQYGLTLFAHLPQATTGEYNIMRSIAVADRLINDGPVYSSFLAMVLALSGFTPGSLAFDGRIPALQIAASLIDGLTCLLIYLVAQMVAPPIAGKKTGIIAALMFALYPSSIINTQYCYAEPYDCFVLMLFVWLALQWSDRSGPMRFVFALSTGVLAGMVALTKPLFLFLPPLVLVLFLLQMVWAKASRQSLTKPEIKTFLLCLVTAIAGLMVVFAPWLMITKGMTGKPLLYVNRSPAFNLYLGNQLDRDGWRAYPFQTAIPNHVHLVREQIVEQLKDHPFEFIALQVRKVNRLWLGPWNEFEREVFFVDVPAQELFHHVLLALALNGLVVLLLKMPGTLLACTYRALALGIIGVHFGFVLVEPISRYNFTAMPMLIIVAAVGLTALNSVATARLVATGAVLLALVFSLYPTVASILLGLGLPFPFLLIFAFGLLAKLDFWLYRAFLKRISRDKTLVIGQTVCFVICLVCDVIGIASSPDKPEHTVTHTNQTIALPALEAGKGAPETFLFVDMQVKSPDLMVAINSKKHTLQAYPWWQLAGDPDLVEVLSEQTRSMGIPMQSLRQWWVVPLPAGSLKFGEHNFVHIEGAPDLAIYGHYGVNNFVPSFTLASWTKGFCTSEHKDARLYFDMPGTVVDRKRSERVFIGLPYSGSKGSLQTDRSKQSDFIVKPSKPLTVFGSNPQLMEVAQVPVDTARFKNQGVYFRLDTRLQKLTKSKSAFINLVFEGIDQKGVKQSWISPWQPAKLSADREWQDFSFGDFIPPRILALKDLKARVVVFPFNLDLLYLRQKEAARETVVVSNLVLTVEDTGLNKVDMADCQAMRLY